MAAKFERTSKIPCPAQCLWRAVHDPAVFQHILAPLVIARPHEPRIFPDAYVPGTYVVAMSAFGFFPIGRQTIRLDHPAPEPGEPLPRYVLHDRGSGEIAKTWDHTILIVPASETSALYTDRLVIGAGLLTPFVAAFARILFAHRQRRLKALAARDFALAEPGGRGNAH